MSDDNALRDLARKAFETGTLPSRRPDRTWGGPGGGAACAICATPIRADQVEYELEFAGEDGRMQRHHVHVRCFAAFELERQEAVRAARAGTDGAAAAASRNDGGAARVLSAPSLDGNMPGGGREASCKHRPA